MQRGGGRQRQRDVFVIIISSSSSSSVGLIHVFVSLLFLLSMFTIGVTQPVRNNGCRESYRTVLSCKPSCVFFMQSAPAVCCLRFAVRQCPLWAFQV